MNKQELQAICLIVNKLGWNDMPAERAINTINKMIKYEQNEELVLYGECLDDYTILLSIAAWDEEKLFWLQEDTILTEVWNMCEFLGCSEVQLTNTVTFYNKIWDKQYVDQMDYEEEMYWAWYDTMMSLRY